MSSRKNFHQKHHEIEAIPYKMLVRSPIMDVTKYVMLAKHLQVNAGKRPSIRWFIWQPISRDAALIRIQRREST